MKGAAAFEAYYQAIYGERWSALKTALLLPKRHVVVFAPGEVLPAELPALPWFPRAFVLEANREFPEQRCYFLDAASLLPVLALHPSPAETVLDLCAAPGGKSLLMAWAMGPSGTLVANDRSPERRGRLKRTLDELTDEATRPTVRVTGHDAQQWGLHEKNIYDKILLDAPCSSERHVLEDPKELASWNSKRPQRLAQDQFTMLCSALDALKPGGTLVYSTCALEPKENDLVVGKLLERRAGVVELDPFVSPIGEASAVGWQVLPDRSGWGPFYLVRLKKI
jgi:16S rRNA C967 or C1407 C5-methylase (RsmB/RsmF family)